jgi:hypothetical protein
VEPGHVLGHLGQPLRHLNAEVRQPLHIARHEIVADPFLPLVPVAPGADGRAVLGLVPHQGVKLAVIDPEVPLEGAVAVGDVVLVLQDRHERPVPIGHVAGFVGLDRRESGGQRALAVGDGDLRNGCEEYVRVCRLEHYVEMHHAVDRVARVEVQEGRYADQAAGSSYRAFWSMS